jgi:PRC-barrel domain
VTRETAANKALRFLPVERVRCGVYNFEHFAVKNEAAESIGDLEGFIVDPPARKVRYAVVNPHGFFARPRLVPVPGTRVDTEHEALLVDDPISRCEPFESSRFPELSDEDVLTAVFAA